LSELYEEDTWFLWFETLLSIKALLEWFCFIPDRNRGRIGVSLQVKTQNQYTKWNSDRSPLVWKVGYHSSVCSWKVRSHVTDKLLKVTLYRDGWLPKHDAGSSCFWFNAVYKGLKRRNYKKMYLSSLRGMFSKTLINPFL
jgi:hypothetical protein